MVPCLSSCQEAPVGAGQRVSKRQLRGEDVWEQIQAREGSACAEQPFLAGG